MGFGGVQSRPDGVLTAAAVVVGQGTRESDGGPAREADVGGGGDRRRYARGGPERREEEEEEEEGRTRKSRRKPPKTRTATTTIQRAEDRRKQKRAAELAHFAMAGDIFISILFIFVLFLLHDLPRYTTLHYLSSVIAGLGVGFISDLDGTKGRRGKFSGSGLGHFYTRFWLGRSGCGAIWKFIFIFLLGRSDWSSSL